MRCAKCHRELKRDPGPDGLGPVCSRNAKPAPANEPDLFFDVGYAVACARTRVQAFIEVRSRESYWAIKDAFKAARRAMGVTR